MLKAWIFEPAGLSTPSGVPAVSRMNTGTSTLGPSAVTVPTVMTSCAAAAAARRVRRTIRALESEDIGRIPGRQSLQPEADGDDGERDEQGDERPCRERVKIHVSRSTRLPSHRRMDQVPRIVGRGAVNGESKRGRL